MKKGFSFESKHYWLLALIPLMSGAILVSIAQTCPPPPPPLECRVTGGGVDVDHPNWDGTWAWGQFKKFNSGWDRYTFGGQAGAPTASQPQPYGEWTHHNRGESGNFTFHAGTASAPEGTEIDLIVCSDPPGCAPSGDPPSPCKRIYFEGVGTFKNIDEDSPLAVVLGDLYRFYVYIEDLGEPGNNGRQNTPGWCLDDGHPAGVEADCRCGDFYMIGIFADAAGTGDPIYEVWGYITGGNLQMHHPIQ